MGGIHLLPDAKTLTHHQSRHDAIRHHDRTHLVRHPPGETQGRHIRLAGGIHDARARQSEVVERRLPTVGPLGSVPRGAGVDESGVHFLKGCVVETQPFVYSLAKILYENIALGDQLQNQRAPFGRLEVEGNALLVAVIGLEIPVRSIRGFLAAHRRDVATRIAGPALLDLDDLGAHVTEHGRADRALLPDRPIKNANPFER